MSASSICRVDGSPTQGLGRRKVIRDWEELTENTRKRKEKSKRSQLPCASAETEIPPLVMNDVGERDFCRSYLAPTKSCHSFHFCLSPGRSDTSRKMQLFSAPAPSRTRTRGSTVDHYAKDGTGKGSSVGGAGWCLAPGQAFQELASGLRQSGRPFLSHFSLYQSFGQHGTGLASPHPDPGLHLPPFVRGGRRAEHRPRK